MSAFVVSNDRSDGSPNVPDANANGKWRSYFWRRNRESGSGASTSIYVWDESLVTPDATYLKWVPVGNFITPTNLTSLQAASTKVSITSSAGNVYFDVVEANIPITGLSGVANASQLPTNIVYNDAANTFSQHTTFSSGLTGTLTGNADTATKLAAGKDITLTGDATGSVTGVDFSQNITINTTVTHQAVGSATAYWNASHLMGRVIGNQVPANGDVYTWNSVTSNWEPTPSVPTALNGLSDVVISNIQNDNIIRYNSTSSQFENVAITTDTVAEGSSNLYYTEARWDTRLGTKTTDDVAEGTTNIYYTDARWDTRLGTKTTDDLAEGSSNLYFTDERVDDRLSNLLSDGDGITGSYNDAGNSYSISVDIKPNSGLDFDTAQLKVDMGDFSTTDLSEGTNLYYTDARWDTRLGTKSTSDLSEGTNLYYTDARWDTRLGTKTTDDVTEGSTNLYFTDERVDDRLSNLLSAGDGVTGTYNDAGNSYSLSVDIKPNSGLDFDTAQLKVDMGDFSTSDLSEGTNLYYTDARWDTRLGTKTTDNLTEGSSNLYYTDARWDTRLGTKTTDNLSEGSSNLYYTDARWDTRLGTKDTGDLAEGSNLYYTDARWDTRLSAKTTDDVSEGSSNLYYTDARWDTRLGTKDTGDLAEGSNLYYTDARWDTRLGTKTTDNLTEGSTNLYHTNARAQASLTSSSNSNGVVLQSYDNSNGQFSTTDLDTRFHPKGGSSTENFVANNLTVHGTTLTKDTQQVNIGDNIMLLNAEETGSPTENAGIEVERGTGTNTTLRWNESSDRWEFTNDGSTYKPIPVDTDGLTEGSSNLYYTNSRWDTRLGTKTTDDLTEGSTNVYYTDSRWDTRLSTKTTDDVYEGSSNLYYTDSRWDTRLSAKSTDDLTEGSSNLYYTDSRWDTRLSAKTTDDVTEGSSNLYYTDSRWDTRLGTKTTDNLTEGSSNLYHTDARAISAVTGSSLNMGSNDITTTGKILFSNVYTAEANLPSASTYHGMFAHVHGTGKGYFAHGGNWHKLLDETSSDTDDLTEGSSNLYYTDARWDTRLGTKTTDNLTEGSSNLYYTDARWDTRLGTKTTDNLTEGSSNLYYTDSRWDTRLGTKTTDNLTEGSTNLYHTSARVDARIGAASVGDLSDVDLSGLSHQNTLVYNSSTGNFEPGSSGGGGGGGGGHTIQDEGTDVSTVRSKLNFVGELVGAADDGTDSTDVTINAKTVWLYAS